MVSGPSMCTSWPDRTDAWASALSFFPAVQSLVSRQKQLQYLSFICDDTADAADSQVRASLDRWSRCLK